MESCKHKYVVYLGEQETLLEGKHFSLYQCIGCGTTLTLNKNSKSIILKLDESNIKKLNDNVALG
ncbi:hypothetical protein ACFL4Z_00840 [candidate division KSB1 bacterium]